MNNLNKSIVMKFGYPSINIRKGDKGRITGFCNYTGAPIVTFDSGSYPVHPSFFKLI